jgi:hypothetical protein
LICWIDLSGSSDCPAAGSWPEYNLDCGIVLVRQVKTGLYVSQLKLIGY